MFTGKVDKYGKQICVGDVLKFDIGGKQKRLGVVDSENGTFVIKIFYPMDAKIKLDSVCKDGVAVDREIVTSD